MTADGGGQFAADAQAVAERTVGAMLVADAFTRWLGAEVVEVAPRRSVVRMTVRPEMVNGLGTCHGGATFALADSAFAFACNSHGSVNVALGGVMNLCACGRGTYGYAAAGDGRRACPEGLPE